jgi:hypothetical protein
LIGKLSEPAKEDLKLGLLSPTCARHLVRLPQGNQDELLDVIRREALTVHELEGVVGLKESAPSREVQRYILDSPREALTQADGPCPPSRDPRLSVAGSQVWRPLGMLLELLARMEGWLTHQGLSTLTPRDRQVLAPRFARLSRDATSVALLSRDIASEKVPA